MQLLFSQCRHALKKTSVVSALTNINASDWPLHSEAQQKCVWLIILLNTAQTKKKFWNDLCIKRFGQLDLHQMKNIWSRTWSPSKAHTYSEVYVQCTYIHTHLFNVCLCVRHVRVCRYKRGRAAAHFVSNLWRHIT